MQRFNHKNLILLTSGIIFLLSIQASYINAGTFGAEIFCTMRDGGNDHESSWKAAYSYIKKQKGGLFKIKPNRAASQIVETVVREREKFSYCVEYLDQLYPDRKLQMENNRKENGIPLHREVVEWYQGACEEMKLEFNLI